MILGVVSSPSYTYLLQCICCQRTAFRHYNDYVTNFPVERIFRRLSRNIRYYGFGERKVKSSGKERAVRSTGHLSLALVCTSNVSCIHYLFRNTILTGHFVRLLYNENIMFRNPVLLLSSGVNLSGGPLRKRHSQSQGTQL